jgi:RND family efflux transporter MFP subunit
MRRLAIVVIVVGCSSKPPPKPPPPPVVDTVTLAQGEVVDATEYLATLRSRTAAAIQPQVDGRITDIFVKPGDRVEANQPLLQIDPGRQPAVVAAAEAQQTAQVAQLKLAKENLDKTQKLVADGAVTGQELDNARTVYESARAAVDASRATIASTKVELRFYKVVAPGPGVVGDIPNRVGDRVTPTTTLTTVTDNSVLEANVSVPVDRAHDVTTATRIDLVDDAGHTLGTGTVKFVSSDVNALTQSVLVKADIDNAKSLLRADQLVRARVVWRVRQGLRVPALAITRVGGQAFVYIAEQQGAQLVAKQRPVKLGDLVDNQYDVVEGVKPGERIATSNLQKLRDGAPIQTKG